MPAKVVREVNELFVGYVDSLSPVIQGAGIAWHEGGEAVVSALQFDHDEGSPRHVRMGGKGTWRGRRCGVLPSCFGAGAWLAGNEIASVGSERGCTAYCRGCTSSCNAEEFPATGARW